MAGSIEFIGKYFDTTFDEKSFCDGDNIALCQISYMPMENYLSGDFKDEPVSFSDAAKIMYEKNGNKHIKLGLVLDENISILIMNMAQCKRYRQMKIVGCRGVYNEEPAVQFGAATYLLPDGKIVVVFRGTDDSLVGWKEDIDIYTKKGIPSYSLAVDYLKEVSENFKGDIIITGHSKGGNVALYAALNTTDEIRDRIIGLYNNDGPGFADYDFLESEEYSKLLPKYHHYVPTASPVGMLLAHDNDYTVVKTNKHISPLQHDLGTWLMEDDTVLASPELSKIGKIYDIALHNWVFGLDEFQSNCFDEMFDAILFGSGQYGLLSFVENIVPAIKGSSNAVKVLDKEKKKGFNKVVSHSIKSFMDALKEVNRKVEVVKEEMSFV